MHKQIIEHISYERGKNIVMDDHDAGRIAALTDAINSYNHLQQQLEELLYLIGDRPEPATEDELMNYVIGMIESVKIKKDMLKQPNK